MVKVKVSASNCTHQLGNRARKALLERVRFYQALDAAVIAEDFNCCVPCEPFYQKVWNRYCIAQAACPGPVGPRFQARVRNALRLRHNVWRGWSSATGNYLRHRYAWKRGVPGARLNQTTNPIIGDTNTY